MKLGNNRRTIVVTMSLMLVAGGVAFLALGASAHREGAFLANLKDLINGISGGNEQLSNLDTYIESEVSNGLSEIHLWSIIRVVRLSWTHGLL